MTSIVKYNTKHLRPVQTISITHNMGSNVDGQCVSPIYNLELNGTLIYNCGSPTSSGTFGNFASEQCEVIGTGVRINSLLSKHCALGSLFSENYKELELGTSAGSPNLKAYPRVLSVSLSDTSNPSYWTYTVSLEADNLYCNGVPIAPTGCNKVKSFEETWDISYDEGEFISESGDNRLWKVSHAVSAVGLGLAGSGGLTTQPYEDAKDFVCARKGKNAILPSLCIENFSRSGDPLYNYYESHNVDKPNGSYSLSESWMYSTNPYIESYSIETQESIDTSCNTVSIQGAVRGFETRVSGIVPATGSRYYNASTRFNSMVAASSIYLRAQNTSGYSLLSIPVNGTVGKNTFTGEISYSYSYKQMPFRFLPSARFESVQVGGNWGEDALAQLQPIAGGEILHAINYDSSGVRQGNKLLKRTLSISAVFPCGTGIGKLGPRYTNPYATELQSVVNFYNPTGDPANYFTGVESQNENWSPNEGKYDYSISWVTQVNSGC